MGRQEIEGRNQFREDETSSESLGCISISFLPVQREFSESDFQRLRRLSQPKVDSLNLGQAALPVGGQLGTAGLRRF